MAKLSIQRMGRASRAGCVDGLDMKSAGEHGSFVSGEERKKG
jgi:hypothetical protein